SDWSSDVCSSDLALGRLALLTLSFYAFTLYGWRWTHIYLGAGILLVTIPAALVLPRHRSTAVHRAPAAGPRGTLPPPLVLPGPPATAAPRAQAPRQRTTPQGPREVVRWAAALRTLPL